MATGSTQFYPIANALSAVGPDLTESLRRGPRWVVLASTRYVLPCGLEMKLRSLPGRTHLGTDHLVIVGRCPRGRSMERICRPVDLIRIDVAPVYSDTSNEREITEGRDFGYVLSLGIRRTVLVNTTLAPREAQQICSFAQDDRQVFESPVSDGPQGARTGSMTIFLAIPEPTKRIFLATSAGTPSDWTHLGSLPA